MENPPFEDVFPNEHGICLCHVSYQECKFRKPFGSVTSSHRSHVSVRILSPNPVRLGQQQSTDIFVSFCFVPGTTVVDYDVVYILFILLKEAWECNNDSRKCKRLHHDIIDTNYQFEPVPHEAVAEVSRIRNL